jgi:hypothetical protein
MEGAASTVTPAGPLWVKKTMRRGHRGLTATEQFILQGWIAARRWGRVFAPSVRACESNSYEMREVDTQGDPWFLENLPHVFRADLARLQAAVAAELGYQLWDVEFYLQPDGRVAMIDFDKCTRT